MTGRAETIIRDLRSLGVETGDHIALGLSFKSLGSVDGGPGALLEALLESVGPNGTLLSPTFTIPSYVPSDYVFDAETTPAYTGLLPETLRRHPSAHRSHHPTSSVVAIGRLAQRFTQDHGASAPEYLPYARLAEADGKILSIGIGDRLVSFWHEAQSQAGLLEKVPCAQRVKYRGVDGKVETYRRTRRAGCTKTLSRLVSRMRREGMAAEGMAADGMVADGKVGDANAILVPARTSLAFMTQSLIDEPELNLCDALTCLWCRQLERTLNLYDRVAAPRLFQRNALLRTSVATVNRVRALDIPQLTRLEVALGKLLSR